jgi:nucleoside-diphosphate-sugar epimerase
MRVLVTGANGFIGAHLVERLLASGHDVACMVRRTSNTEFLTGQPVRFAHADVADPSSLPAAIGDAEIIYHLAGRAFARGVDEFIGVNQIGVRNLVGAAASRPNPPTVVHVSSLAAAGTAPADRVRTEDDMEQPVSDYGRSKLAGELEARALADRVPISVVRPAIVFGPRDRQSLELFRPVRRFRVHVVPGYMPQRMSFVHVADLCELIIAAGERGTRLRPPANTSGSSSGESPRDSRGIYFAASEESPTFAEFGRMVAVAVGRPRALIVPIPKSTAWLAGEAAEITKNLTGRTFPFGRDKAREAIAGSWACSIERARSELGYRPEKPLAQRVGETARWYLDNKWL